MKSKESGGIEMPIRFAAEEYQECKKWIAQKIQEPRLSRRYQNAGKIYRLRHEAE